MKRKEATSIKDDFASDKGGKGVFHIARKMRCLYTNIWCNERRCMPDMVVGKKDFASNTAYAEENHIARKARKWLFWSITPPDVGGGHTASPKCCR
jgi:hypothetical protein